MMSGLPGGSGTTEFGGCKDHACFCADDAFFVPLPPFALLENCAAGYHSRVADSGALDDLDRAILALLVEDGRRSVVDIADRVSLSAAPVKRRIDRLERLGVIAGYTALVDHGKLGAGLEAFVELRFAGDVIVEEATDALMQIPEIQEILTVAGDPDALARVRLNGIAHLRDVIDRMRHGGRVIGTKTLIVVGRKRRGSG